MYQDAFTTFPTLTTERLVLRKHAADDARHMDAYAGDPLIAAFYDGWVPEGRAAQAIEMWYGEPYARMEFLRWCIARREDDRCMGGIYLFLPYGDDIAGRRMDIGYEISPEHRGHGYVPEAMRAVTRYAFGHMGVKRVQAQILPDNLASLRAAKKAGFTREGVLRNFCHYQANGQNLRTMVMMACVPEDCGV